jgi:hypothetical protein
MFDNIMSFDEIGFTQRLRMTNDALQTYLQDHLAGALHAIELLKAMRDHFAGQPLGQFASQILAEVEADRDVLARLTEGASGTRRPLKIAFAAVFFQGHVTPIETALVPPIGCFKPCTQLGFSFF